MSDSARRPAPSNLRTTSRRDEPPNRGSFVRGLVRGLQERHVVEAACSIAFRFFLALIPLLVLAGWIIGHWVERDGIDLIATQLVDVLPASADDLVYGELERMASHHATALAPASALAAIWMGASGAHHLMDVFETALRARRRPWLRQRLLAMAWVSIALALGVGAVALSLQIDRTIHPRRMLAITAMDRVADATRDALLATRTHGAILSTSGREVSPDTRASTRATSEDRVALRSGRVRHRERLRRLLESTPRATRSPFERALLLVLLGLVATVGLAGFYRFALVRDANAHGSTWRGALAAVALTGAASIAFAAYVRSVARYTLYYGSLAAVTVLLFWLFLASLALLVGMEINVQLERTRAVNPTA